MKQTTISSQTSSPAPGAPNTSAEVEKVKSDRHVFIAAVTNLTWQMAVVVLVPIVGGIQLDKKFETTPLLTIIGFIVTTLAVGVVLWRQLQQFTPPKTPAKRER